MALLEISLSVSADDGEVISTGGFTNTGGAVFYGHNGAGILSGFYRFPGVTIPQGSTITDAVVELYHAGGSNTLDVTARWSAQDEDDPIAIDSYSGGSQPWDTRTPTTATVDWIFQTAWSSGVVRTTPELKTIIQEMVDRGTWASGDALMLMLESIAPTSGNEYSFEAVDGTQAVPKLIINYSSAPALTTSGVLNGGGSISAAVTRYENQTIRPISTITAGGWDTAPATGQNLHDYASDDSDATWIEDTTV